MLLGACCVCWQRDMACHDGWLYTLVVLTILSPALYSALTGFYERVVSGVPPRDVPLI